MKYIVDVLLMDNTFLHSFALVFCATFAYKFSPTKIMNTIFVMISQKRSSYVGRHFLKWNNVGHHFCLDFQGFCPDFRQIKTFGDALAPPAPPPPTPLIGVQFGSFDFWGRLEYPLAIIISKSSLARSGNGNTWQSRNYRSNSLFERWDWATSHARQSVIVWETYRLG